MKRVLLPLLTLAALGAAWQIAPVDARPGPSDHYEDEPWVVLSVADGGRILHIQGRGGGCGVDPRATATETLSTITIRVQQRIPDSDACTAMARIDDLRVRLLDPIDGRRLIGQSLRDPAIGLDRRPRVPNVLGLRAEDARFALRAQGFRVAGLREGMVGWQIPSAGGVTDPSKTTVSLSAPEILPLRPVEFHTVASGGIESALQKRTAIVVRSEARWRALWRNLTAGDNPRELPPIDFSREMLLVAAMGPRPAGDDRIRITSVGATGTTLVVQVSERVGEGRCNVSDVAPEALPCRPDSAHAEARRLRPHPYGRPVRRPAQRPLAVGAGVSGAGSRVNVKAVSSEAGRAADL